MENENKLSDWDKAHKTARWAETMTRWMITKINKRWRFASFRGLRGQEAKGIVDIIAIARIKN